MEEEKLVLVFLTLWFFKLSLYIIIYFSFSKILLESLFFNLQVQDWCVWMPNSMQWSKQDFQHISRVIQMVAEKFIAGQVSKNEEEILYTMYNVTFSWIYASLNCSWYSASYSRAKVNMCHETQIALVCRKKL